MQFVGEEGVRVGEIEDLARTTTNLNGMERWFGEDVIERLRGSLRVLVARIDFDLPDCLPILGYGLFSKGPDRAQKVSGLCEDLRLPALPSRALLAFAIDFRARVGRVARDLRQCCAGPR